MKLLLDTHIFLWSLLEPEQLMPRVAEALEDPDNELWLSPITTWECLLLAEEGRVLLKPNADQWVRQQLRANRFIEAPLNHEVALQSQKMSLAHRDPADRFLAATAVVFELVLVTADKRLHRSPRFSVLANC